MFNKSEAVQRSHSIEIRQAVSDKISENTFKEEDQLVFCGSMALSTFKISVVSDLLPRLFQEDWPNGILRSFKVGWLVMMSVSTMTMSESWSPKSVSVDGSGGSSDGGWDSWWAGNSNTMSERS